MKTIATLAAAVALPGAVHAASITDFTSLTIFGDSLSDAGRAAAAAAAFGQPSPTPAELGYFEGRQFSNDAVWADTVGQSFAAEGVRVENLAFGGARADNPSTAPTRIPDFDEQIDTAVERGAPAGDRALAAVWFGANDLFATTGGQPLAGFAAIEALNAGLGRLQDVGYSDVLVFNLPDLGELPGPREIGSLAQLAARGATLAFNAGVANAVDGLLAGVDAPNAELIDTFALFDDFLADTDKIVDGQCVTGPGTACDDPDDFVFFDDVHPTGDLHDILAEAALAGIAALPDSVAPVPLPAGGILLLGGFAALGGLRVRTRRV